jgi:acylphosphatase
MMLRPAAWVCAALSAAAASAGEGLRVDRDARTIVVDGKVAQYDKYPQLKGAVEYGAVATGAAKAYESILELEVKPQALFDALKELGARPGAPRRVDENGKGTLPHGSWVALFVEFGDGAGRKRLRFEEVVTDGRTGKPLAADAWLFAGSEMDEDPRTGKMDLTVNQTRHLLGLHQADRSVLLQNPVSDPASGSCPYRVNAALLPKMGTPVTLVVALADPAATGPRRLHALVKGKVQGVGFRDFTATAAKELQVAGWVRNLADGDVELVAEGPAEALRALGDKVCAGPPSAKVDNVVVLEAKAGTGEFKAFEVRQ